MRDITEPLVLLEEKPIYSGKIESAETRELQERMRRVMSVIMYELDI